MSILELRKEMVRGYERMKGCIARAFFLTPTSPVVTAIASSIDDFFNAKYKLLRAMEQQSFFTEDGEMCSNCGTPEPLNSGGVCQHCGNAL